MACGFLSATANPTPPPKFRDSTQDWSQFVSSDEYRGYVHIPPIAVTCDGGNVTSIDGTPVQLEINSVNIPQDHSLGFTPGRNLAPGLPAYSGAEPFVTDATGSTTAALFDNAAPFVTVRSNGSVLVSYLSAARIATVERYLAAPLTGYDAPYIWTVTQKRGRLRGRTERLRRQFREFPTTNLYLDGKLTSLVSQTNLPQFYSRRRNDAKRTGRGIFGPKSYLWSKHHIGIDFPTRPAFPRNLCFYSACRSVRRYNGFVLLVRSRKGSCLVALSAPKRARICTGLHQCPSFLREGTPPTWGEAQAAALFINRGRCTLAATLLQSFPVATTTGEQDLECPPRRRQPARPRSALRQRRQLVKL